VPLVSLWVLGYSFVVDGVTVVDAVMEFVGSRNTKTSDRCRFMNDLSYIVIHRRMDTFGSSLLSGQAMPSVSRFVFHGIEEMPF